jgi:hypothetical protein
VAFFINLRLDTVVGALMVQRFNASISGMEVPLFDFGYEHRVWEQRRHCNLTEEVSVDNAYFVFYCGKMRLRVNSSIQPCGGSARQLSCSTCIMHLCIPICTCTIKYVTIKFTSHE